MKRDIQYVQASALAPKHMDPTFPIVHFNNSPLPAPSEASSFPSSLKCRLSVLNVKSQVQTCFLKVLHSH